MEVFDELFFENLFHENYDKVYSRFLKKTGSPSIAADLAQLTFTKLWQYRHSFTFRLPAELQVNRNAKLIFIDWLRKEAHQRKIRLSISESLAVRSSVSQFELSNLLQSALNKLPPHRKKVFLMAYMVGYSYKEIAARLNISTKTVDAHIAKALLQLRQMISFGLIAAIGI